MKILFFILIFLGTFLSASELVTKTHLLKGGEEITFYPKQGESFAVSKDFWHLEEGASYNVAMKNGNYVYFESKNQEDDMYIIFNEPTDSGDVVHLKVNSGYFTYTTESFEALPKTVKKVLKASAKRRKFKKKSQQNHQAMIETEEFCFDGMGEIVECYSPLATINQPYDISQVQKEVLPEKERRDLPVLSKDEKKESVFASFADKVRNALNQITENLKSSKTEVRENITGSVPVKNVAEKKHLQKVEKDRQLQPAMPVETAISRQTLVPVAETPKMGKTDINQFNNLSDHEIKTGVKVETPAFHALPVKRKTQQYEQMSLESGSRVTVPSIDASVKPGVVPDIAGKNIKTDRISAPLFKEKAPVAKVTQNDLSTQSYGKPVYGKQKGLASIESAVPAAQIKRPQMTTSQPVIEKQRISAAVAKNKPVFSSSKPVPLPRRMENTPASVPQFAAQQRGISSQTTAGPEGLQEVINEPQLQKAPVLAAEVQKEPLQEVPQMQKPEAVTPPPPIVQAEVPEETSKPSDKIVITKIIDKKKKEVVQEPIERMSDRILGGGYSSQHAMGKVSVKAYSNRKPISAWVEVYKGKRRVKTFYTSGGKTVKLPAGTYIMKATYRTGTSKQKKSLGKVKLQEGETIRKKVYFNVGKLKIVASRRKKPVYVKVEIYKKGSNQRYAYTFSSRTTGQAHLQLAEGSYKIIVLEHRNKKVFDNVYIKGNDTKTIRVEF